MAGGWTRDGEVNDQIADSVADAVNTARAGLPRGDGSDHCIHCGEDIPAARRKALPGVRTCVTCQARHDARRPASAINRRGSKDSQLR